ncbi:MULTISPECIES: winged helix-turn-helix domain-containing protein [unclassified Arthrobacter]|uniref:winged helix-turn-helix domain-containing protein n=1 Tax=unclassified Arthrobacter TaxID=235627 RepID=UPI00159D9C27|nr:MULTISPECIES: winged helix-turn-helix domain-containing protein [unclassified Arthrobacter]MCQ9165000.1 winged helix-turn-helix domain-containing protein [Arthrobacter sp. STN4]NVM98936.1 winged helix-turn-helix transcriptional regulator [Arthrobacter sp. SDTb3-6]
MSVASGYVHISVRNAAKAVARSAAQPRPAGQDHPSYGNPAAYRRDADSAAVRLRAVPEAAPMTAPTPVIAGSDTLRGVNPDNVARGFVLYVGVDEDTAAAAGTSLAKLAQDIRAYAQSLVPQAQSYAAVAIAPSDAVGSPLDVVRSTFGDPTVATRQRPEPVRPPVAAEQRPTGVLIDLARREVHLDGETLNLTFKEFELLNYLVENGTRTVGRDELLDGLWGNADEVPNERTIDVHVRRLRSKLGRLANTVRTVRGEGYRFYEHPEVVVWAAPEYSI